jgi:diaminopimelate epimerase
VTPGGPLGGPLAGRPFVKMTGSGNDFVFFDVRDAAPLTLDAATVRAICARGTGVGADGIVVLGPAVDADAELLYVNADGSAASLCGNATLCAVRLLSGERGAGSTPGPEVVLVTGTGTVTGRVQHGIAEIDLDPAGSVTADLSMDVPRDGDERALGFALAGVPHLVVLVDDVEAVDVAGRGAALRRHRALGAAGANVNFVAPVDGGGWAIRTYERGVEGETLACGTGVVASANLVRTWGADRGSGPVSFRTRSGSTLRVRLTGGTATTAPRPSLSGEGRTVFRGTLEDLALG